MSYRQQKGLSGEKAAAEYLKSRGFEILEQRYRYGHKEIDLVARKAEMIVFVEVKSRGNEAFGPVELSVSPRKRRNLVAAACGYLLDKGSGAQAQEYRFDVVLLFPPDREGKVRLEHIEDAFRA